MASEQLTAFVGAARAGLVQRGAGGFDPIAGGLADGFAVLEADDLDALTAEAYNQEALPADLPWAQGLERVRVALAEQEQDPAAMLEEARRLLSTWDEEKHPRHKKGVREGGRFAPKDGAPETPPIVEGLTDADMEANADRYVAAYRKSLEGFHDEDGKTFDELMAEEDAALRAEPLVHATSAEAAAMIWEDDGELRSRAAMQPDIAQAEDELRALIHEALPDVSEAELARPDFLHRVDLSSFHLAENDVDINVAERMRGLTKIAEGTTYPEDVALGLDRYVFAHHGRTSAEYGTTEILVDNGQLARPGMIATPRDIVRYAEDAKGTPHGNPAEDVYGYPPAAVAAYRKEIVTDGGYWRAAAAERAAARIQAGAQFRSRWAGDSFEVKLPERVARKHIVGFIAGTVEDHERLLEAGVPDGRIYYLPTDASNYAKRFGRVVRHAQANGDFAGLPDYEALPKEGA